MLKIKKSRIPKAGKGLFTTSQIRKGDLIVEYKGEKLTWAQCEKRYGKKIDQAKYLFYVSKNNCVDAEFTQEELARYANDAEGLVKKRGLSNNSEYCIVKGKPYIIATRKINKGEEIFVDYQREYWEAIELAN
jgi:SET domain-containing protein